jgi:chromate reductase, NAD(P)H dehydrogenase (quinone)
VEAADALLIACPEYNYAIAGPLKNAIDWVSRARPMPWKGRSVYLLSASPSPMGGIRGLWQTRVPLEGCGALVFPDMFALAHAKDAFDEHGGLKDERLAQRLSTEVVGFVRLAEVIADTCLAHTGRPLQPRQRQIADALEDETDLQPPA